jgi:hypothetical protein
VGAGVRPAGTDRAGAAGYCGSWHSARLKLVPLDLLLRPRPGLTEQLPAEVAEVLVPLLEDDLAAKDAVAALRRYSLASPAGDGAVSVHRLVQAVTADQMPADLAQAWQQAAAALIEAALPGDPQQPTNWPVFAALLPHARAVLDLTADGMRRIAVPRP